MTVRTPVPAPPYRTRMVLVKDASNSAVSNAMNENSRPHLLYPEHQHGVKFTALVSKEPRTIDPKATFQPVPNAETQEPGLDPNQELSETVPDPDDFPLEELEAASESRLDVFNQRELKYHDELNSHHAFGEFVTQNSENLGSLDPESMEYISESDDDDDAEVAKSHRMEKLGQTTRIHKDANLSFSDSGASSAFSPPQSSFHKNHFGGEAQLGIRNSPTAPISSLTGISKPPRQGFTTGASTTLQKQSSPANRPTSLGAQVAGQAPPMQQNYVLLQQLRNQKESSNPMPSNFNKAGQTTAKPFVSKKQGQDPNPSLHTDTTPLVSNGRKAIVISPNSSPDRNVETADIKTEEQSGINSELPNGAVDNASTVVGTLAHSDRTLLKDSTPTQGQPEQNASSLPQTHGFFLATHPLDTTQQLEQQPYAIQLDQGAHISMELSGALDRMNLGEYKPAADRPPLPRISPQQPAPSQADQSHQLHPQVLFQRSSSYGLASEATESSMYGQDQSLAGTKYVASVTSGPPQSNLEAEIASNSANHAQMPSPPTALNPTATISAASSLLPPSQNTELKPGTVTEAMKYRVNSNRKDLPLTPMMRMRAPPSSETQNEHSTQSRDPPSNVLPKLARSQKRTPASSLKSESFQSDSVASSGALHDSFKYLSPPRVRARSGRTNMTEEEFRVMKQRKWKEKKKIADRTREREKDKMEGSSGKKKKGKRIRLESDVGLVNLDGCQTGLRNLFTDFMEGSCGRMEDDGSESEDEEEESTLGESTQFSESETRGSSVKSSIHSSSKYRAGARNMRRDLSRTSMDDTNTDEGSEDPQATLTTVTTEISRTDTMTSGGFSSKVNLEKFNSDSFLKDFVKTMSTTGMKFLYHQEAVQVEFAQPKSVTAWLLLGSLNELSGRFSEPRMELRTTDAEEVIFRFDLFDIRAIEKASMTTLKSYPVSPPASSILIRSDDQEVLVEAPDEEVAAGFVHGFRSLIARISFNLIVGNAPMTCELLESVTEAPGLTQQERAMNDVSNSLADKSSLLLQFY